uniref:hypothetical protein n=1 Tax=Xenorhabdus sp. PB61.4 TaxID=2788940 RepID=UPI001E33ABBC
SGNIDVKFYAKKVNNGYTKIISLKTTMGETVFTGDNMLFVTEHLPPTDGIGYPRIPDLVGGVLSPPRGNDGEDESVFHITIPEYAHANPEDIIFVMNNNTDGDAVCTSGEYSSDLEAPYTSITQIGNNEMYYYVNRSGLTYKSGSLYYSLAGHNPNMPPLNGTLDKVSVFNGNGELIDEDDYVNADSIADNGLNCEIPVGGKNQPQLNDLITVNVKINGYDPDTGELRPPFNKNLITKQQIKEVDKFMVPIPKSYLSNYDENSYGDAGYIYIIYYLTNKKEKSKVWKRRIDTITLGAN